MHHAFGKKHRDAEIPLGPGDDRIPRLGLQRHEPLWAFGAIAYEVGAGIVENVADHRLLVALHPVDDAVREPGQRHGRRIDTRPLPAPFLSDRLADRLVRHDEPCLAGGAHGLAVEQNADADAFIVGGNFAVEALEMTRFRFRAAWTARRRLARLLHAGALSLRRPFRRRLIGLRSLQPEVRALLGELLEIPVKPFEFAVVQLLEIEQHVARLLRDADQLVDFDMQGGRVAVLRVLDHEHHQEGDDGRRRVDHELPGIAKTEQGPGEAPHYDARKREQEGNGAPGGVGYPLSEMHKPELAVGHSLIPLYVYAGGGTFRIITRHLPHRPHRLPRIQKPRSSPAYGQAAAP